MSETCLNDLGAVLHELEALGTAQNRKIYRRHGAQGELFGVSFANLNRLERKLGTDHSLALRLWRTGNVDARFLATMVADPAQFDDTLLEAWLGELEYYALVDSLVKHVVSRTPLARAKAGEWTASHDEWRGAAGYDLVALLALNDQELENSFFEQHLSCIEREIHLRPNRTRHSMNMALIAIGGRNPHMRKLALACAAKVGKVEVDHKKTGCKTPEAIPYIQRIWARKKK